MGQRGKKRFRKLRQWWRNFVDDILSDEPAETGWTIRRAHTHYEGIAAGLAAPHFYLPWALPA